MICRIPKTALTLCRRSRSAASRQRRVHHLWRVSIRWRRQISTSPFLGWTQRQVVLSSPLTRLRPLHFVRLRIKRLVTAKNSLSYTERKRGQSHSSSETTSTMICEPSITRCPGHPSSSPKISVCEPHFKLQTIEVDMSGANEFWCRRWIIWASISRRQEDRLWISATRNN